MVVALPPEVVRTHVEHRLLEPLPIALELRLDPYGDVTRRNHPLSPGGEAMLQALRAATGPACGVECKARRGLDAVTTRPAALLAGR